MKSIMLTHKLKVFLSWLMILAMVNMFLFTEAGAVLEDVEILLYEVTEGGSKYAQLDVETFAIPAHLGEIKYSYKGDSNKVIIHIQDAHCNKFAQNKISGIIDYLNKEFGISMVNLEGGVGEYDLRAFTSISGEEIRKEVAEYFVEKGDLNGAEVYAINNPANVMLWGIEDKDLYLSNLKVYRDSLLYKREVEGFITELGHILDNLKRHIFNKALLRLDSVYNEYKEEKMEFREYVEFLMEKAKAEAIQTRKYKNLFLLAQTMRKESTVNFKRANKERELMIKDLKKILSGIEIRDLASKSLGFKTKRVSRRVFYDYLLRKARESNVNVKRFPALSDYIVYVSLYEAIDNSKVMDEMDELEEELREPLFLNDTQRRLVVLSRNLALLKNIFSINLTKKEYLYYLNNKDSFKVDNYLRFIDKEAPRFKIPARPDETISRLDVYLEEISKFYEYSFERDEAFIKNMKLVPTAGEKESAIIMTGGFHTENLCDLFKEQGISYVSLLPKFTIEEDYENPYFDLLAGQTTDVQSMLSAAIARSAVALMQIASKLSAVLGKAVWGENIQYLMWSEVIIREYLAKNVCVVLKSDAADTSPEIIGDRSNPEQEVLVQDLLEEVARRDRATREDGVTSDPLTVRIMSGEAVMEAIGGWKQEAETSEEKIERVMLSSMRPAERIAMREERKKLETELAAKAGAGRVSKITGKNKVEMAAKVLEQNDRIRDSNLFNEYLKVLNRLCTEDNYGYGSSDNLARIAELCTTLEEIRFVRQFFEAYKARFRGDMFLDLIVEMLSKGRTFTEIKDTAELLSRLFEQSGNLPGAYDINNLNSTLNDLLKTVSDLQFLNVALVSVLNVNSDMGEFNLRMIEEQARMIRKTPDLETFQNANRVLREAIKIKGEISHLLVSGGSVWATDKGGYGTADFIFLCLTSGLDPASIHKLMDNGRRTPGTSIERLDRNRKDATAVGQYGGLRDWIYDQMPRVNDIVNALVNFYDNYQDNSARERYAERFRNLTRTQGRSFDAEYYLNKEFFESNGETQKTSGEKKIDILRRLRNNTKPDQASPEITGFESFDQAIKSLDNYSKSRNRVSVLELSKATRAANRILKGLSMEKKEGINPNFIISLIWLENQANKAIEEILNARNAEYLLEDIYKTRWFAGVIELFMRTYGFQDVRVTEESIQALIKRVQGSRTFKEAYRIMFDKALSAGDSWQKYYKQQGADDLAEKVWSVNLISSFRNLSEFIPDYTGGLGKKRFNKDDYVWGLTSGLDPSSLIGKVVDKNGNVVEKLTISSGEDTVTFGSVETAMDEIVVGIALGDNGKPVTRKTSALIASLEKMFEGKNSLTENEKQKVIDLINWIKQGTAGKVVALREHDTIKGCIDTTKGVIYLSENIIDNPLGILHELGEGFVTLPVHRGEDGSPDTRYKGMTKHMYMRGAGEKVRIAYDALAGEYASRGLDIALLGEKEFIDELQRKMGEINLRELTGNVLTESEKALIWYNYDNKNDPNRKDFADFGMEMMLFGLQDFLDPSGNFEFTQTVNGMLETLRRNTLNMVICRTSNMKSTQTGWAQKGRRKFRKLGIDTMFSSFDTQEALKERLKTALDETRKRINKGKYPKIYVNCLTPEDLKTVDEFILELRESPEEQDRLDANLIVIGNDTSEGNVEEFNVDVIKVISFASLVLNDKRLSEDFGLGESNEFLLDSRQKILDFCETNHFFANPAEVRQAFFSKGITAKALNAFMQALYKGAVKLRITRVNWQEIQQFNRSMQAVYRSL